ncbi:MAG: hypothetical protein MI924_11900 [Chloroflexales bacterium]|nr:hypothetical protein [Chloroflexales bacterium]
MAFLILLEKLNPGTRTVFLLRDVFDYDYVDIAAIVERSEANCRQIARRARESLATERARAQPNIQQQQRLLAQFVKTCSGGDMARLVNLLAEDIVLHSDGGGGVQAALHPIFGAQNVARFLLGILRKTQPEHSFQATSINGQTGIVLYTGNTSSSVVVFDFTADRLRNLYIVMNPDKLRHVPSLGGEASHGIRGITDLSGPEEGKH